MKKVDELFAFVTSEHQPEGHQEGIIGVATKEGWMPLVGADMERVNSIVAFLKTHKIYDAIPYRIYRFSNKEDITNEVLK